MTGSDDMADDEARAYHEAGHAVAMWRFGFGIAEVSIVGRGDASGHAKPARIDAIAAEDQAEAKRACVERRAMYLLAGDVAMRLLRPGAGNLQSATDHKNLHHLMASVEDDGSVQFAWCAYLWQRVFTFISWPGQWYLIVGLAHQLIADRTLSGAAAERYLTKAAERLEYDPWMPNCVLVGDIRNVCSPFHRHWYAKAAQKALEPKRTAIPTTLAGLSAQIDTRLIRDVLSGLSTRAHGRLLREGIRTVGDLEDWTPFALWSLRGISKRTLEEILAAMELAGVHTAPDTRELPWQRNGNGRRSKGRSV
jgi:hypothetical protein